MDVCSRENREISNSSAVTHDESKYDTPQGVVDAFARYFGSVYTTDSVDGESAYVHTNTSCIHIPRIMEIETATAIRKLKNKMTAGPDGVPSFLVRDCRIVLIYPLTRIFNLAMSSSTFPDLWKCSKVGPVLKGDLWTTCGTTGQYRFLTTLQRFSNLLCIQESIHL